MRPTWMAALLLMWLPLFLPVQVPYSVVANVDLTGLEPPFDMCPAPRALRSHNAQVQIPFASSPSVTVPPRSPSVQSMRPAQTEKAAGPCEVVSADDLNTRPNFAAAGSGATVRWSSTEFVGTSNILIDHADKYARVSCSAINKTFVIQLCEDIVLELISLINSEHYSSGVHLFQLEGSVSYPSDQWLHLGYFRAQDSMEEQAFCVKHRPWVRFLKFKWLSHHREEKHCTITSLKVYGSGLLAELQEPSSVNDIHGAPPNSESESNNHVASFPDTSSSQGSGLTQGTKSRMFPGASSAFVTSSHSRKTPPRSPAHQVDENEPIKDVFVLYQLAVSGKTPDKCKAPPTAFEEPIPPMLHQQKNIFRKLSDRIGSLEYNQSKSTTEVEELGNKLLDALAQMDRDVRALQYQVLGKREKLDDKAERIHRRANATSGAVASVREQLHELGHRCTSLSEQIRFLRAALAVSSFITLALVLITWRDQQVDEVSAIVSRPEDMPSSMLPTDEDRTPLIRHGKRRRRRNKMGRPSPLRHAHSERSEITRGHSEISARTIPLNVANELCIGLDRSVSEMTGCSSHPRARSRSLGYAQDASSSSNRFSLLTLDC